MLNRLGTQRQSTHLEGAHCMVAEKRESFAVQSAERTQ
jgi:hypothetical protein